MLGYLVMEEDGSGFKPLKVFKNKQKAKEYALLKQEISDLHCWGFEFNCYLIEIVH